LPPNWAQRPINIANGDVSHDETDFSIPNLGAPLAFRRHYDSLNTVPAAGIRGTALISTM